ADLAGVGLRERATEDGEVLSEDEDRTAVDASRAGDDPITRDLLLVHAEVVALMDHELVDLNERAGVEEQIEPLPRRLLPCLMLAPDPIFAAAQLGLRVTARELVEPLVQGHRCAPSMA